MVATSFANHDTYATNSQFITHLMGENMGSQGLAPTPIDTNVSLHLHYYIYMFDSL